MGIEGETSRLEAVAGWYSSTEGFNARLSRYGFESMSPFLSGSTCLELGPADGEMTAMLLDAFDEVTSVDGSPTYCEQLRDHFEGNDGYTVDCALFEEYEPQRRFDTVLASHVLEHVDDPVAVMAKARSWVAPGGRLLVLVPNANSLHRLLGVKMGLLSRPDELNEMDRQLAHRRVYDQQLLASHIREAGWSIANTGGAYLKPLSNKQMEDWFSPELMDGFYELGKEFPDLCVVIYAVCELQSAAQGDHA